MAVHHRELTRLEPDLSQPLCSPIKLRSKLLIMLTKIKALNDANKINQHWENSREASAATEECILTVFIRYFNGPSCEKDITAEADRGEKGANRIHQRDAQPQKQTVIFSRQ